MSSFNYIYIDDLKPCIPATPIYFVNFQEPEYTAINDCGILDTGSDVTIVPMEIVLSINARSIKDSSAHPHFHCLLMVPPGYFAGKNYLRQSAWVEMWRKAMRLDYDPILDVRAIRESCQPMGLVPEILKYCTKESDLVADRDWLIEYTKQMHKTRCVATGGVLRQFLSELEDEPEDLIGTGEDLVDEDEFNLFFNWVRGHNRYRLVE